MKSEELGIVADSLTVESVVRPEKQLKKNY